MGGGNLTQCKLSLEKVDSWTEIVELSVNKLNSGREWDGRDRVGSLENPDPTQSSAAVGVEIVPTQWRNQLNSM